jgi:hypothetical protein
VQWQIGLVLFIVAGKHVKCVPIKIGIKVTVPAPGSIRVRVMARAGTVVNTIFGTFTDPVPIWVSMGMDTGTVSGSSKIVRVNKPQFHGRRNGGNGEELLQGLFIIKGEIPFSQGIIRYLVSDAGMSVGKLFILSGFGRRFFVLAGREQVTTSGLFEVRITQPQTVDKVKVRAKRRKTVRGTANEKGKKVISLKLFDPFGKTGKLTVEHKDKGA